ncbi:tRNA (adenosine(37)-N6)-dimethylallyltransferase MiaA [Sulfoacidibacillus thermotolerans]|uniref:tRNA (adenosine(37)-N6)-dimethylallyltransferase MiaA n=1 Tax=Sulfoacidibacillus thermotolerans TaxID=1765684 RepID=UPI001C62FD3A|nr:tRNA (adenosine(37)-N6)-dimethylallyltransferase MiaA [Sulfoacidibacillus thermotolerans]
MRERSIPIVCLVGPTAVGKTWLSLEIAERLRGEIVSADSMQVYRKMDIGTAKLPFGERRGITHYMIDVVEPTEVFTAYDYTTMARPLLKEIYTREKLPLLVGGTGLYVRALVDHLDFTKAARDEVLRDRLGKIAEEQGAEILHGQLQQLDPDAAAKIHPNDHKRLIRALEIVTLTGKPLAKNYDRRESPFIPLFIGLTMERTELYARIDKRVDEMIEKGLVQEVEGLLAYGCTAQHTSMQAIGYKELVEYIHGQMNFEDAVAKIKQASRRYAKRQLSWFRADPRIQWYTFAEGDMIQSISDLLDQIQHHMAAYR